MSHNDAERIRGGGRNWADKLVESVNTFERGILAVSSNLYAEIIKNDEDVRFLKILRRGSKFMVILGTVDADGTPVVAFGWGENLFYALRSLGSSIAADVWKVDEYAVGDKGKP